MVRFCVVFFLEFKVIEIKSVLISVKGFFKKMIINIYAIFTYCRSCYKAVFLDLLILFLFKIENVLVSKQITRLFLEAFRTQHTYIYRNPSEYKPIQVVYLQG